MESGTGVRRFAGLLALVCLLCGPAWAQENLQAWFTRGQTFLLWQHSRTPHPVYAVYSSGQPIHSLRGATLVELVLSAEGENSRLISFLPGARWRLPDTSGNTLTVDTSEAYAVLTPQSADSIYVAVVRLGDTVVGSGNTAGPVRQRLEPVEPTVQYQNDSVTIYGHWVDGRAGPAPGRADYPVMANQFGNGSGHNFAVWEPPSGQPSGSLALLVALHGGGGNLLNPRQPGFPYATLDSGLVATLDDGLCLLDSGGVTAYENSFWLGYWDGFNRFAPSVPPDTAQVIDYTVRRMEWELGWLRRNLPIDTLRVSLMGASMGGMGTLLHTQLFPGRYSAGVAFVPPLAGPVREESPMLIGTRQQNLGTTLPGSPGVWDVLNQTWRAGRPHPDWPLTVVVCGRNDTVVGWHDKPAAYRLLDSARTGFMLYWDQREHTRWAGAHFASSGRSFAAYPASFRAERSFPAFSFADLDTLMPGRQPDPGDGGAQSGDTWGTWGGYLDWDRAVIDSADCWEARVWAVTNSNIPCDNSPSPYICATVTPRRARSFRPLPGARCVWQLADTLGNVRREGVVCADSSGAVTTVPLAFTSVPSLVRIRISSALVETEEPGEGISRQGKLFPNPAVSSALLHWLGNERLELYDGSGRRCNAGLGNDFEPGLAPGVYFVRPRDSDAPVRRLVIVR